MDLQLKRRQKRAILYWQDSNPFFRDFKLSGRSGFDHHFDFAFPMTKEQPQRVLVAINALTRDLATSTAFAVNDFGLLESQSRFKPSL